jgi:spore coat polysaccharide biosynthesis protein SpsF (cytidylyltransferase family)
MKDIIGLVAVRCDSTRLLNKAFRLINGVPMLEVLVDRLIETPYLDDFIVCTTSGRSDDRIETFCKNKKVKLFRGEEKNVLGRFVGAARDLPSEYVVRITGDNPLSNFDTMHQCHEQLRITKADYSRPVGVPMGTACEVIRTKALYELNERTLSPELSEYMTYFFELADFIRVELFKVTNEYYFPELSLTVDYESDLEFLNQVVEFFDGQIPALPHVINYCRSLTNYPKSADNKKLKQDIKNKIKFRE